MTSLDSIELTVNVQSKSFSADELVLEGIDFRVAPNEFVTLLGPSGAGKTTLLRIICGLDKDFVGSVTTAGANSNRKEPPFGIVFQESRLLPWMNVLENVVFAMPERTPRLERTLRATQALKLVKLSSSLKAWPYQLSGGMEKRVAIARALVNLPSILLLDEPFAAVDPVVRAELQDEVERIHFDQGLTTLLVTHDIEEAVQLSDRILLLGNSPSKIEHEIPVDLPRPRDRNSLAQLRMRAELLALMKNSAGRV